MGDPTHAGADRVVPIDGRGRFAGEDRYRRIFLAARDGFVVARGDGRVVEANPSAQRLLGYAPGALRELRLFDLVLEADARERLRQALGEVEEPIEEEVRLRRADGTSVDCQLSLSVDRDTTGGPVACYITLHDITQRKRTQQQLVHNAFHDALTGLPNRLLFMDRLERLLRQTQRREDFRFAVLFLDLDRFKQVNDVFGHLAGDELLASVARRLERCLRQGDSVARLGGDEFAIILDDVRDASDATRVADRILAELEAPFVLQGRHAHVSASIGIAFNLPGGTNPDHVLRDADAAMYRAKGTGRARYEIFDTAMHERAMSQLQIEMELTEALARREFAVHYQPVVALDGGSVMGLEALVRWSHPKRGTLLPAEFISVAEQSGAIVEIGWYVLREACRQLVAWRTQYPDTAFRLTMSVNLSAKQFLQPDLLARLDTVLRETGLEASSLRLELTEAAVMSDTDAARRTLAELRQRGIQICIDDFGSGYSSLQQLRQLPISNLKVDRAFVRDLAASADSKGIVQTIIALGQSLAIDAIAEGVETPEQLDELRALGMKFAQGFLFSMPQDAAGTERLLRG